MSKILKNKDILKNTIIGIGVCCLLIAVLFLNSFSLKIAADQINPLSSKWKDSSGQESLDKNEVCNTFCSFVYDNVADCSSCMLARQLFETHVTKKNTDVIEIYVDEELRYFRFDAIVDALVKTNEFYENSDCEPVNIVFHAVKLDRTYGYGNAIWCCVKDEYSTPICDVNVSLPAGRLTKDDCLQELKPVIQSVFPNI